MRALPGCSRSCSEDLVQRSRVAHGSVYLFQPFSSAIFCRWTFSAKLKGIPGQRAIVITGTSLYTVNSAGILLSQTDAWDAIPRGGSAQIDSLTFLLRSALSPQSTPDLDTPQYTVLRKLQEYEVRSYKPFLVAEVDMPPSASPSAGTDGHLAPC